MNGSGWSLSRWALCVAAIFSVQIAVIWVLGERGVTSRPANPFGTTVRFEPELSRARGAAEIPDPASLALPSASGFSGDAWLNYHPPTHSLAEWTEPPRWLRLSDYVALRPASVSRLVAESRAPLRIADEPLPWSSSADTLVARLPLPEHSRLEFEGDIVLDGGVTLPELPSWPGNEPIGKSVVRVAFHQTGAPFSCVLVDRSGLDEADKYAIALATGLRFRSPIGARSDGGLRFGKLVFHWHTVPTSANLRGVTSLQPTP
jgi:hypothetical protein